MSEKTFDEWLSDVNKILKENGIPPAQEALSEAELREHYDTGCSPEEEVEEGWMRE
mgnify:CR=1 FL=1|jgi:hypothetical protein